MQPGMADEKERRLRDARAASVYSMPPRDFYEGVGDDLIAGLQLLDELGDVLLPTTLLELTPGEARALVSCFPRGCTECRERGEGEAEHLECLGPLEARLDRAISTHDRRAFVKLSFMSPKDVALRVHREASRAAMRRRLGDLWERGVRALSSENEDAIGAEWLCALYDSLQVHSGEEALEALTTSYRCNQELTDGLISEKHFDTRIAVRPWVHIRSGFEFRCFVSNKILTAVSQYERAHYPEVWASREQLTHDIREFVEELVIPKLQHRLPSFVCDVVVTGDGRLSVCELNPFAASSSACLFSWSDDKDTLMIGPQTFRFVPPNASSQESVSIPVEWREFITEFFDSKSPRSVLSINGIVLSVAAVALAVAALWRLDTF